jgi:hypothetical protein
MVRRQIARRTGARAVTGSSIQVIAFDGLVEAGALGSRNEVSAQNC